MLVLTGDTCGDVQAGKCSTTRACNSCFQKGYILFLFQKALRVIYDLW